MTARLEKEPPGKRLVDTTPNFSLGSVSSMDQTDSSPAKKQHSQLGLRQCQSGAAGGETAAGHGASSPKPPLGRDSTAGAGVDLAAPTGVMIPGMCSRRDGKSTTRVWRLWLREHLFDGVSVETKWKAASFFGGGTSCVRWFSCWFRVPQTNYSASFLFREAFF